MANQFNPENMDRLLVEGRREWNDPSQVLGHLELAPGAVVTDIGCGPGWFSLEAARQIGEQGLLYGVDLSEAMLQRLQERAGEAGLANVKGVLAEEADEWPIPTESCDAALIANVYHEVDPASMFIGEVKRILKPGATCLVVEWRKEKTPGGPPLAERLDPEDVTEEFTAAGFRLVATCDVGPYHFGLKFTKPHA